MPSFFRKLFLMFTATLTICFAGQAVAGQAASTQKVRIDREYLLSGPYVFRNLAIYLVHGSGDAGHKRFFALSEALDKGWVTIDETGEVNRLTAQNHSKDTYVFIQSGDMLKGGRQDRTVGQDMILPPKSKKTALAAFCIEQGRWNRRGGERTATFASSRKQLSSKELKLAAKLAKSQGEVWKAVADEQARLSRKVGKSVQSEVSATSLQLSLEDKALEKNSAAYRQALLPIGQDENRAVGFAYAINGRFSTADIYGTPALFQKLWPKLIEAAANEAVALEKPHTATAAAPTAETVKSHLLQAMQSPKIPEPSGRWTRRKSVDTKDKYAFETRDDDDQMIHLNIIEK